MFTLLLTSNPLTIPPCEAVTESEIRDAILDKTEPDFNTMDLNKDGLVDVADLVQFIKAHGSFPTDLYGYVWLIAAVFSPENGNIIPIRYPFAISITKDEVVSTTIPGFNPTKGILRQNMSGPGEVPGVNRPSCRLSLIVPEGTFFSCTETGGGQIVTLRSDPTTIEANDPKNPVGVELHRFWTIEIDNESLFTGGTYHGTITEETTGFLPDSEPIITTGRIYLAPFSRVDLAPIEQP